MSKRLILRVVFLLVIVGGAVLYMSYFQGIDVATMLRKAMSVTSVLDDMNWESLRPASVEESNQDGDVLRAGRTRVYKWKDSLGQWHYTQKPPPAGAASVSSIDLDPELNVIAGIEIPEPADSDAEIVSAPGPVPGASPAWGVGDAKPHESLPDNPYSAESIKQLFEDTEALKETMEQRQHQLSGVRDQASD